MNKKESICQAAIELLARDGYHATTTDSIAQKAGVAVGTIYNYFKNKKEILDHIFQEERQKREALYHELQQKKTHDPMEQLQAIIDLHLHELAKNPILTKVILREKHQYGHNPMSLSHGLPWILKSIMEWGIAQGKLRSCDPSLAAYCIFGALHIIMEEFVARHEQDPQAAKSFLCKALEGVKEFVLYAYAIHPEEVSP